VDNHRAMAKTKPAVDTSDSPGLYPIRTLSSLTGVNSVTLRAWERRYNLIRPQRTAKGHRLYTQRDVERIQRVLAYINQGIAISQVKPLLDGTAAVPAPLPQAGQSDEWERYRTRMQNAIQRFDEQALDAAYNDALSLYPADLVIRRLATPVLRELGERWKERPAGVAEEHFFSVYLRNKLGARLLHLNAQEHGPRLLMSCLPGEQHEIGMLFFALAAVSHGYRLVLFGANLPLEQIPPALEQRPCDAVVLSGSARPAHGLFDELLPALVKHIDVPVFVGGGITARHAEAIDRTGAIAVGQEFQAALARIAERLDTRKRR
jgi:DNA-binding transcriptional MerR regulator/methylmalonyl-CoA mutase cobalamin-binding subunit